MNSSYKIALAVAAALCLVILGYYISQSADDTVTADGAATDKITESVDSGETVTKRPSPAETTTTRSFNPGSLRPPARSDSKITSASTSPSSPPSSPPPGNSRPTLRDMVAAANASDAPNEESQTVDVAPPPSSTTLPPSAPSATLTDAATPPVAGGANTALSTETVDPAASDLSTGLTTNEVASPPSIALAGPTPPAAIATTAPPVDPAATKPPLTYVVEPGDTFAAIAEKVYGDERFWVDIAQANPTVDPKRLKIDQVLQMPPAKALVPASPESASSDRAGEVRYTVRPGDSLSSIAQQYYGDPNAWRTIFNANREAMGNNPDAIEAGKILVVPPAPGGAE